MVVWREDIEGFLKFTTETEENFRDGWLPTPDTAVKITEDNLVMFKFNNDNNKFLQNRSSMGENQKITVLTQEVIRRRRNTKDGGRRL